MMLHYLENMLKSFNAVHIVVSPLPTIESQTEGFTHNKSFQILLQSHRFVNANPSYFCTF